MKHILFVDDEIRILDALRDSLRPYRRIWHMSFAHGPAAAQDLLAFETYDVVVTDLRMPKMDGAQLLSFVMRVQPNATRVVLSGAAPPELIERVSHLAHFMLNKPCTGEELHAVLSHYVPLQAAANRERD
jgi:DNA-binding NtrC family response regulator